ncbi:helix-turn-helix transcriptional regulator [Brevibacillus sp. M2.1A]|uniref:winged helix-turn-helix transcriptional regulator n=1 Tax=Brevibacillus TaxID=55080 RepID=UPI00156A9ACA|nr:MULTISPECIES: helix-turn-helix domain-containing protein [Brevibacillus]MBY0087824.1 helix-turn-helix transcriptional regulator [Brevibacillus brevis]MCC8433349.1 helix-turn-helix transcriptional regulator [Brevibacillus sp. M2.1A]MCE0450603.1 helix-turn-helix transcriptional regulator [Brevibacillus sp. AF8]UKL01066.1 helix-turn-helix transcriptional regulator [Brevibacillus brevis]
MPYQDGEFGCPVEVGLQLISGKWKPRIIYELLKDTRRFGELQRLIPEVSRHVLTVQLRELENSEIVVRQVYPTVPPKVEYSLTDFGKSVAPILEQMIEVGEQYISRQKKKAMPPEK